MIKCPNAECGHENVDGTQFCEACGEELNAATAASNSSAPASTTTSSAPDMIKCPSCDNLNPADNVVCEVCGSDLHPAGSATAGSAPSAATTAATTSSTPAADTATPISSTTSTPSTTIAPSADAFATGTTAPPLSATLPDAATTPIVGVTATSNVASSALADMTPDVGGTALSTGLPVVASGDTTTPFDPTATATAAVTDPTTTSTDPATSSTAVAPMATPSGNLQPGAVKLTVEQGMTIGKQFVLGDAEVLVGREDDEEGIYPDIDLSDQDEGYVHRKHAQLSFKDGALTVTHLGGANRTRVNNKPLDDNVPQAVNLGDKVSFGKVVMRVGSV